MPIKKSPFAGLSTGLALLGFAAVPAAAQLPPGLPIPPESFVATHPLGVPFVIDTRHLAMGSAFVADDLTGWHGNPAGTATVRQTSVLGMYHAVPFDKLPELDSSYA